MAFVQIIDFRTSKIDEVQAAAQEWEKATEGKRKTDRRVIVADRDNPGRYLNIVFFDSYEQAMENSGLPETDALSKQLAALCDGPPSFINCDVVDERP